MDEHLRKYWWIVGAVVVAVCAVLFAKTTNHVIEAFALADSAKAKKRAPKKATTRRTAALTGRSKAGQPLEDRNMFCSDCVIEEEVPEATVADGDTVPLSSLPLRLVATSVATSQTYSYATVRNTSSLHQGAYGVDDVIPNAGPIREIRYKYIHFLNKSSNRVEKLSLVDEAKAVRPTTRTASKPTRRPSTGKKDAMSDLINEGVKKTGDNEYEVDRALVNKITENPLVASKGARIVPAIKGGKPNGFRLYAIRPSSVYAKLGIKNGDTIHAINGFELNDMSKGFEIYSKLKSASNLSVTLTRRGKPVNLNYTIR